MLKKYFPRSVLSEEEPVEKENNIIENMMQCKVERFREHCHMLIISTKERIRFFQSCHDEMFGEKFMKVFLTKIKELINSIEEILPKTKIEQVNNFLVCV